MELLLVIRGTIIVRIAIFQRTSLLQTLPDVHKGQQLPYVLPFYRERLRHNNSLPLVVTKAQLDVGYFNDDTEMYNVLILRQNVAALMYWEVHPGINTGLKTA